MSVKWYGNQLLAQLEGATPDALFDGGQMFIEAASSRAPKNTGALVESAYVASETRTTYRKRKRHSRQATVPKGGVVAGFAAFYARFVEYGTKTTSAKPFLRPTLDELKDKIGAGIVVKIGKQIK